MTHSQVSRTLVAVLFVLLAGRLPSDAADHPRFLFGTPTLVEGISTPGVGEDCVSLSSDGLDVFFASNSGKGEYPHDLYVAHRDSTASDFSSPVPLSSLNTERAKSQPNISSDGLTLYYVSGDPAKTDPTNLVGEIWTATRSSLNEPFGNPSQLLAPQPGWGFYRPSVSSDGRSLYLQETDVDLTSSNTDVYVSHRDSMEQPWGVPQPVPELSKPNHWQSRPFIAPDDLSLFFYDSDGGSLTSQRGGGDLAVLVRPSPDGPWSTAVNLGNAINSAGHEDMPSLSPDGQTLYFSRFDNSAPSDAAWYNSADIWQAPVLPFTTAGIKGQGGSFHENFDSMGTDVAQPGGELPSGWTFTANDVVFNNTTTSKFPPVTKIYSQVSNAGTNDGTVGDTDRALVTDVQRTRKASWTCAR